MKRNVYDSIKALEALGISYEDATALRRISMTLHRWHELECGDGNEHGSWTIARGTRKRVLDTQEGQPRYVFEHDDAGKPWLEHHHYLHGKGDDYVSYSSIPDRERGALWRLAKIVCKYNRTSVPLAYYVQTDPRGCSLYIIPRDRVRPDETICAEWLSANYTRGIAVCK